MLGVDTPERNLPGGPLKTREWVKEPSRTSGLRVCLTPSDRLNALGGTRRLTIFRNLADRLTRQRFRRGVSKALALTPRGGIPKDSLILSKLFTTMRVEWQARDIHPWDRDLSADRRAEMFVERSLNDTNAAIQRLFQTLPEVDVLEIRVLEPHSGAAIIAGTVSRDEALTISSPSPGMRLKKLGVDYRLRNWHFEPLA